MFDRIVRDYCTGNGQIQYASVVSTDSFLTVHLQDCGLYEEYCEVVSDFIFDMLVPWLEAVFIRLGDFHVYRGMFSAPDEGFRRVSWLDYV